MIPRRLWASSAAPALVLVVALGCSLFAPALFGGKVLSPSASIQFSPPFTATRPAGLMQIPNRALNDNTILFEDHLAVARDAIRSGRLPLWDPFVGAGRPYGGGQGAPLYPTSFLAYILPFWASLGWIALLKLIIGGLGIVMLCRSLALSRPAALLAGVSFAFSNLYIEFLGHGQVDSFAIAPWALLAAEHLAATGRPTAAGGLGLALGLALYNGHPESFFVMAVLVAAYLVFRLITIRSNDPGRSLRSGLLLAAGAGVLAVGIGAFALVALIDVLPQSISLSQPSAEHAHINDLFVGAVLPEFWGRPDKMVFNQTATPVFSAFYFGRPYIGGAPALLAAIGLLKRPTARQCFFLVTAIVCVVLTLGGPILSGVRHIPGFSQVNAFEYMWPLLLAGSVLAAYGTDQVLHADPTVLIRGLVLVAVVVLAALADAIHLQSHLLDHVNLSDVPTLRRGETSAGAAAAAALIRFTLIAAALAAALLAARRASLLRWVAAVLVALTVVDLGLMDHGWWPMAPQSQVVPRATETLRLARAAGPSWRLAGFSHSFTPDLAERYDLMDARLVDLPQTTRYSRLWAMLGGTVLPGFGETLLEQVQRPQLKLLDLFSVRWLLDDGASRAPGHFRRISARRGDGLLENRAAFPRAFVAYGSRPSSGPSDSLRLVGGADTASLYREPVIEGSTLTRSAVSSTPATFRVDTSTREVIDFTARRPGWLVVGDTFFPGWGATIDGRAVAIHAANADFQAMPVPPGSHVAELRYQPTDQVVAAAISGVMLAMVLIGLLVATEVNRRGAPGPDAAARADLAGLKRGDPSSSLRGQ